MPSISRKRKTVLSRFEFTLRMFHTSVSCQTLPEVVAHGSVKTNTALDREARKRATSVYLVQRAVPMLPPQLSEELCSLVPGAERLTFTVTFKLDAEANVQSYEFKRSIIK